MSARRKSELDGYLDRFDRSRGVSHDDGLSASETCVDDEEDSLCDSSSDEGHFSSDDDAHLPDSNEGHIVQMTPARKPMRHAKEKSLVITIIASIFFAIVYIGIGFGACAGVPFITESIANATIDDSRSPFEKSELVHGASAVREYSFGDHDAESLFETIHSMNFDGNTPYADVSMDELLQAPSQYTITQDELAHLDDVYDVAGRLFFPILGVVVIATFLLMFGLQQFGVDVIRRILLYSGILTMAFLAILGIWGLISFDALFAVFHSMLFVDGTWMFPADSLLITMLPESFWMAMAAVVIVVSCSISILSILLSAIIGRRRKRLGMVAGGSYSGNNDS